MQFRFNYLWSMCKHKAKSVTKENIRSQDLFFPKVEKAEVIASATAKKSESMTLVIWDLLAVTIWHELINVINHIGNKSNNQNSWKNNNYNWITPLISFLFSKLELHFLLFYLSLSDSDINKKGKSLVNVMEIFHLPELNAISELSNIISMICFSVL